VDPCTFDKADPDTAFSAEYRSGSRGFDDKKNYRGKNITFFKSKSTIYLSPASVKDVQVTKEAFSSEKGTSSTQNMKFLNFFATFVGHFYPPESGSRKRTRIH
jgi:hypothetical protein